MVRVPLSSETFSETGLQLSVLRLVDIQQYHFTSLQALDHYETRQLQLHTGNAAMIRNVRLVLRTIRLELERHSSLSALAMCEARVRLDYQKRCRKRFKDAVSRALRDLYQVRGRQVRWDDLLDVWKSHQLDPASRLVIGVNDDGSLAGLTPADIGRLNQLVSNAATEHMRPPIAPVTQNISYPDGMVMVVTVPEGISKPYMDNKPVFNLLNEGSFTGALLTIVEARGA